MQATVPVLSITSFSCIFLICDLYFLELANARERTTITRHDVLGGDVTIFDDVLSLEELFKLEQLLVHEETTWNFFPKEVNSQLCCRNRNSTKTDCKECNINSCYQWMANLNSLSFAQNKAWRTISEKIISHSKLNTKSFQVCNVNGIIVTGGDVVQTSFCKKESISKYTAVVFLVREWKRNGYGEMLVYGSNGEILKAIYPRRGRIVILPCSLKHVIRPPAIGSQQHMHAVVVSFTSAHLTNLQKDSTQIQQPFSFLLLHELLSRKERPQLLQVDKYLTKKFLTKDRKPIIVFDGVISNKDLEIMTQIINYGSYNYVPPGPDSDNVQWIMQFEVDDFINTTLWQDVKSMVKFVSGEKGWFPYDIGCNNIRNLDNTKLHNDLTYGERADVKDQNEYTFLLYLNPNWTENFHGETVFFEEQHSPNPEIIFAVTPKHGRVCIFHGSIPHSARPPSLEFRGKVSCTD